MLPSMYSHRCSEDHAGGFFERVKRGTWMGHVIEHIALEIQTLAGMETGFGRTRSTREVGVYNVVFSYIEEPVGMFAAKSAVRIAEALISGEKYDLEADIQQMRELREDSRLGPSTGSIVQEAVARGIPYLRLNGQSLVQLGHGIHQKRIRATITSRTSNIGVEIACDKEETKQLLESYEIPVPKGRVVRTEEGLEAALDSVGFPCMIKPIGGNHGRGATIGIKTLEEAKVALAKAKEISRSAIVERYITGLDHRLLVINHRFVAGAKRTPACVIGDGKSTIAQLAEEVNKDPRRGFGHENVLTRIDIDDHTLKLLASEGTHARQRSRERRNGVLEGHGQPEHRWHGGRCHRSGAPVQRLPRRAHQPHHRPGHLRHRHHDGRHHRSAERIRRRRAGSERRAGLPYAPGTLPVALGRNVAEPVVDMLFPLGTPSRIPIIAVTGTNGKTTTTRLTATSCAAWATRWA